MIRIHSVPKRALKTIATSGKPFFRVFEKILGAFPDRARPSVKVKWVFKNKTLRLLGKEAMRGV